MKFVKENKSFLIICLLALIPRLLLSFFNHPWDIQTFYNFFVDLAKNHSPYDTMEYLTYSTSSHLLPSFNRVPFFEYWAYPPLMVYLYWPIAKLFSLLHPYLNYDFVIAYAGPTLKVPPDFNLFFKTPIFLADFGIAWLLYRMVGKGGAKMYLFNPYIIFIGATWMFDSVMAFFLLASLYFLEKEKVVLSSSFLALGALTKFIPYLIFPVALIYLLRKGPVKNILLYSGVFLVWNVVLLLPFWQGFSFILNFQAQRMGGGISPYLFLNDITYYLSGKQIYEGDLIPMQQFILPNLSTLMMGLGILFSYYLMIKKNLSLRVASIIVLLFYLATSRLINEQYFVILIPLLIWEIQENPEKWKKFFYQLFWAVPFAFALVNVPVLNFSYPLLNWFKVEYDVFKRVVSLFSDTSLRRVFTKGIGLIFPLLPVVFTFMLIDERRFKWIKNLLS